MYVCHVGSEAGMGMNVPRHDHTCSCHVIGHFIQNTMLQVGVHRSSPLEEGGVGQKKEWTNWLQSWKDKPSINRSVDSGENLFSCWRFGFLQPINAWDPQLKCRLLTNLGWKDVWLWKESFRLFAKFRKENEGFALFYFGRGKGLWCPASPELNYTEQNLPRHLSFAPKHCSHPERIQRTGSSTFDSQALFSIVKAQNKQTNLFQDHFLWVGNYFEFSILLCGLVNSCINWTKCPCQIFTLFWNSNLSRKEGMIQLLWRRI